MPPDKKEELLWLVLFIVAIGAVLIVTVMLLMTAWRRHLSRVRGRAQRAEDMPDIWQTGGQRLTAKMSPFPRPDDHDHPGGPGRDSPDDDDDDA